MAFIKEEPVSPTAVFSHIITEQRAAQVEKSNKHHLHIRQSNPTSVAPLAIPARIQQIYNEFDTSPMMSPPALQFDSIPDTKDMWNGINIKRESVTRESSVESNTPHSCLTSIVPLAQEPEDFGCSPMFESQEDPSTWSSLFADEDQAIYIKQETDLNSMETSTSSLVPSSSQMSLSSSSQLVPTSSSSLASSQSWSTSDGSTLPASTNEALREFLVNSARLQGGMDPLAGLTMLQSLESLQSKNSHSDSISSTSSSNSASSSSSTTNNNNTQAKSKSGTEPHTSNSKVTKSKSPQEKAQLKRARNTEAARRSRARKTERLSELEGRCSQLTQRNQQLEMEVLRLRLLMARSQELSSEATFKALFDKNF